MAAGPAFALEQLQKSGGGSRPDDNNDSLEAARFFSLSLETLGTALQLRCRCESVRIYLSGYERREVIAALAANIAKVPILHCAAQKNCTRCLGLLLSDYGADANSAVIIDRHKTPIPVLAFAISHAWDPDADTTDIVKLLLAHGADPHAIPADMWRSLDTAPAAEQPDVSDSGGSSSVASGASGTRGQPSTSSAPLIAAAAGPTKWCTPEHRAVLAATLTLTQRYGLRRAAELGREYARKRQISAAHGAAALLHLPYYLVGQMIAIRRVTDRVLAHLALGSSQPLVLLFTGPSGHGKTELARQMGRVLSLDIEVVDCAQMKRDTEIFGPRMGYSGYENGAALNNFLANHNGRQSVVFLDEFDKSSDEVREAMLLLFDSGE